MGARGACSELVERDERELISYKHDGGRLAFSLTLKFFELEGPPVPGADPTPQSRPGRARTVMA